MYENKKEKRKALNTNSDLECLPSALNNRQLLLLALGLTLLTFMIRTVFRPGYWLPLHIFEPAYVASYIAMFSFGILAYKNQWLEKIPVSVGIFWGVISGVVILLAPPIIIFRLGGYAIWAEGLTIDSLIVSAWESFLCVGLCISLPILFRQKFNGTNKILKKAAKYSFGVYLIHPFVIIPIEVAMINLPLHPMLKSILASIVGIILCYLLCHVYALIKDVLSKKTVRN